MDIAHNVAATQRVHVPFNVTRRVNVSAKKELVVINAIVVKRITTVLELMVVNLVTVM
jgi:hypothetical protein